MPLNKETKPNQSFIRPCATSKRKASNHKKTNMGASGCVIINKPSRMRSNLTGCSIHTALSHSEEIDKIKNTNMGASGVVMFNEVD